MITGIARLSYLAALEPKANKSGVLKYSVHVLIPKTDVATIAAINAEIKKATAAGIAKGKFTAAQTTSNKFKNPLRDGDAELASGDSKGEEHKGHYFFNANADTPPGVVGRDGKPMFNVKEEIYSGMYGRIDAGFYPFNNGGSYGVAVGFNNMMKWADGERLDNRQSAEDAFNAFAVPADETPNMD